jgi:tetratricopeptide (TPR) repeat protein
MGKSRLLDEFRQRLIGRHVRFAAGQCLAYGNGIPYLPILDLLRDHCGIGEGDGPEGLTAKVRLPLKCCEGDLEAELPLLLELLGVSVETDRFAGLSADGRRARTFETLWQVLLATSRQQPLILAVDNLQWIDPTSEAFLAGLIERVANVPLLVLTTTRPGYRPPWVDRSSVMQLALPPLAPDASRQVVQRVLGRRPLAPALEQQLLAKAEGNPFFLEELAHTVREQEGGSVALAVPNTMLASCYAELGMFAEGSALGEEGLRIAEAVDHPGSLMYACYGIGVLALCQGDLPRALPWLERAVGLCHEADLSLFFPSRAAHLGAAYTLAGRLADALSLLTQAMEQATATETVSSHSLCRLHLGEAQLLAGRLEEAHALTERVLAHARERQERGYQAYALRLLGDIAVRREPPESTQAEAHYQQALALAEELGMRPLVAHSHHGLGRLYGQTGQQVQARAELLAAITLYRAMEMAFWLPETEAALAEVQGDAARS